MRQILAVLIMFFLFIPLAVITLALIAITPWAFDRNFYHNLVEDERLYEVLLSEDLLPGYVNVNIPAADLPIEALGAGLRAVLTANNLRDQALRVVDVVFDFIEGRNDFLDLYIDLTPLKAPLLDQGGRQKFADAYARALRTCAAGQAPAVGTALLQCRPSEVSESAAADQVAAALPGLLASIPDRITLTENMDLRRELGWADTLLGATMRSGMGVAIGLMVLLSLFFLLILGVVASASWRGRMLWMGSALLLPALLWMLVGAGINTDLVQNAVDSGLREARVAGTPLSLDFQEAVVDAVTRAASRIANSFLLTGVVTAAVGVAAIGLGLAMRGDEKRKQTYYY